VQEEQKQEAVERITSPKPPLATIVDFSPMSIPNTRMLYQPSLNLPTQTTRPPRQPRRVDTAAASVRQALEALDTARLLQEVREALATDTLDAYARDFTGSTRR